MTQTKVTKLDLLEGLLSDGRWHQTDELVEKVGHCFSVTLPTATKNHGWRIQKRRVDGQPQKWEYKLLSTTPEPVQLELENG